MRMITEVYPHRFRKEMIPEQIVVDGKVFVASEEYVEEMYSKDMILNYFATGEKIEQRDPKNN